MHFIIYKVYEGYRRNTRGLRLDMNIYVIVVKYM